jgi:HAD superfamily hydrolase (TIGR01509 family)
MASKIRALLFDLDGVLIDAREWHFEALNRALALFGYEINRYEHLTTLDGLPTREKLKYVSVAKGLPSGLHALINELKQIYTKELISVKCFPSFNVEFALARLKRSGFKLAVCTNSVRQTLDLMLSRSAIAEYFDVSLSNEDVAKPKPSPEIYLKAIASLHGLTPEDCLVIEDNHHGLEAARSAGVHIWAVKDPTEVTWTNISRRISEAERA